MAVYGVKSHHVRTVRKAAKDPWITNISAHIGGAQFEPSWPVDRANPRGARRSRKPKPRYRMTDVRHALPGHSFAVLNILERSFVNYIMSHPLLHSAISSSPVIAGFNYGLRDTNLPRIRTDVATRASASYDEVARCRRPRPCCKREEIRWFDAGHLRSGPAPLITLDYV